MKASAPTYTECRKCGRYYERPAHQVRRGAFRCNLCVNAENRAWRLRRKAAGNPVRWLADLTDPVERRKMQCRTLLNRAVQIGFLERGPCEVCGDPKSHGHHTDYSKPLEVQWLCVPHHGEAHRGAT